MLGATLLCNHFCLPAKLYRELALRVRLVPPVFGALMLSTCQLFARAAQPSDSPTFQSDFSGMQPTHYCTRRRSTDEQERRRAKNIAGLEQKLKQSSTAESSKRTVVVAVAAPRHCLARGSPTVPKAHQIPANIPYFPSLTLSNVRVAASPVTA